MDYLGQDFLTSEYDSMSVDAILAEFKAQSAAGRRGRLGAAAPVGRKKTRSGKEIERRASFHAFKAPEQA